MADFLEGAEIMSEEAIENLFADDGQEEQEQEKPAEKTPEEKKNNPAEEPIDPENLFGDETPESVGREEDIKDQEGASSKQSTSPQVFSSLAKTLQEGGILLELSQEEVESIKDIKGLEEAVNKWARSTQDEVQKRVMEALDNGMDKDEIRQFEYQLKVLEGITPEALKEEGDRGEDLRRRIIYRDYLNRGFSEDRARREVERAIKNGTDIEDAEEALKSIKESTQTQYDNARAEAKRQSDEYAKEQQKQAEELKDSILKGDNLFGLEVSKVDRQKIFDNISRPVYKDPETGDTYTAIQKFEKENRLEFLRLVSTFLTLTDWGKNLDGLVKGKVKKEVGKATKELERAINNTQTNSDGSLRYAAGVAKESYLSDFTLDV